MSTNRTHPGRALLVVATSIALVVGVACGSNGEQENDAAPGLDGSIEDAPSDHPDARVPDGRPPDMPPAPCATLGKPCTKANAKAVCGSSNLCLLASNVPSSLPSDGYWVLAGNLRGKEQGVCTCACTAGSCPSGKNATCESVTLASGAKWNLCLQGCQPKLGASDCEPGVACRRGSGTIVKNIDKAVCFFRACAKDSDCPITTSQTCSVSKQDCPSEQTCLKTNWLKTDVGRCCKPGTCDLKSGLCGSRPASMATASAKIGDPCKDDSECSADAYCNLEWDPKQDLKKPGDKCVDHRECCNFSCVVGKCPNIPCPLIGRNGYCTKWGCLFKSTLTTAACGAGADCVRNNYGGICLKTCSLSDAKTCRGHAADLLGDYECRDMSAYGISSQPVCDSVVMARCGSNPKWCPSLGGAGNPTNMACRGLDGKLKASATDPTGFCLDDTASGTTVRSPLP